MGQNNSELISNIAKQFTSQVAPGFLRTLNFTSGYFNAGRTLKVENQAITTNDPGVLNRIFDSVIVDTATRAQFYKAVMGSQDPIHEILLPLIDAIAEKIMVSDRTNLNPTISADFKKYAEIRSLFSDDDTFRGVMLRAIASACLANLADFVSRKIKPLMVTNSEENELKVRAITQAFTNQISGPFDAYLSSLTAEKFKEDLARIFPVRPPQVQDGVQQDRHWFVAMLLRAFQNLIHLFSGQGQHDEGSAQYVKQVAPSPEIERNVNDLLIVANNVAAKIAQYGNELELLENVQTFSNNLAGLIDEINIKRQNGTDFQESAQQTFKGLCARLSERLGAQIPAQEDGPKERAEVMRIVNELIEHVSPSRSTTPGTELDDSGDEEISHDTLKP